MTAKGAKMLLARARYESTYGPGRPSKEARRDPDSKARNYHRRAIQVQYRPHCPECDSLDKMVVKHCRSGGKQRWQCKTCKAAGRKYTWTERPILANDVAQAEEKRKDRLAKRLFMERVPINDIKYRVGVGYDRIKRVTKDLQRPTQPCALHTRQVASSKSRPQRRTRPSKAPRRSSCSLQCVRKYGYPCRVRNRRGCLRLSS